MSKADVKPVALHNHVDGVLQDYLDQLLVTATISPAVQAVPVVAETPVVRTVAPLPVSRPVVAPAPQIVAPVITETVAEPPLPYLYKRKVRLCLVPGRRLTGVPVRGLSA